MKTKKSIGNEIASKLELGFEIHFGNTNSIKLFRSPSSIIILGDHTQYNDGIMISTVVNSYFYVACRKVDKTISIACNDKKITGDLTTGFKNTVDDVYLNSLVHLINNLVEDKQIKSGFECFIKNETNKVFGLGNHAAVIMGILRSLSASACINLNNQQMVEEAVKSETKLFGPVVSRALYYSSLLQKENSLLYYDTRTDHKKFFTIDKHVRVVICNTNIVKENFHEKCKDRIIECEVGVKGLRLYIWGIKNLRDVEEKFLERHIHMLPKRLYSRCLYNVLERKIVEEAHKYLRNEEFHKFYEKLNLTHKNLSENYEISSPTMDKLVQIAEESKLCLGSKMISCSYHDSTLNFVNKKNLEKFYTHINKNYFPDNGAELDVKDYSIVEGAKQIKLSKKNPVH